MSQAITSLAKWHLVTWPRKWWQKVNDRQRLPSIFFTYMLIGRQITQRLGMFLTLTCVFETCFFFNKILRKSKCENMSRFKIWSFPSLLSFLKSAKSGLNPSSWGLRLKQGRFQKVASTHDHPGGEIKVKTEGERFLTSDRASLPWAGGCGKIKAWQQMESGSVYFQQLRGNFLYISESVSERIRENFLDMASGKKSQAVTYMTSSTSITFGTPLDLLYCIPYLEMIWSIFPFKQSGCLYCHSSFFYQFQIF